MNKPIPQRSPAPCVLFALLAATCQMVVPSLSAAPEPRADKQHLLKIDIHSYDGSGFQFAKYWNPTMMRRGVHGKEGIIVDDKVMVAYAAPGGDFKAVCIRFDMKHALILVHFEKKIRDDVAITVVSENDLPSKFLASLAESMPGMVDPKLRREGHILAANGMLDGKIFGRDFDSFLGDAARDLLPEGIFSIEGEVQ